MRFAWLPLWEGPPGEGVYAYHLLVVTTTRRARRVSFGAYVGQAGYGGSTSGAGSDGRMHHRACRARHATVWFWCWEVRITVKWRDRERSYVTSTKGRRT